MKNMDLYNIASILLLSLSLSRSLEAIEYFESGSFSSLLLQGTQESDLVSDGLVSSQKCQLASAVGSTCIAGGGLKSRKPQQTK